MTQKTSTNTTSLQMKTTNTAIIFSLISSLYSAHRHAAAIGQQKNMVQRLERQVTNTSNSRHEQGSPEGALQCCNLYTQFQLHEKIKPTQKMLAGGVGREGQLLIGNT